MTEIGVLQFLAVRIVSDRQQPCNRGSGQDGNVDLSLVTPLQHLIVCAHCNQKLEPRMRGGFDIAKELPVLNVRVSCVLILRDSNLDRLAVNTRKSKRS